MQMRTIGSLQVSLAAWLRELWLVVDEPGSVRWFMLPWRRE